MRHFFSPSLLSEKLLSEKDSNSQTTESFTVVWKFNQQGKALLFSLFTVVWKLPSFNSIFSNQLKNIGVLGTFCTRRLLSVCCLRRGTVSTLLTHSSSSAMCCAEMLPDSPAIQVSH